MDERTERLRDIFRSVTDDDTVTEAQSADRGSLAGGAEDADEVIAAVVARMREEYDFETDLAARTYVRIVRGFFAGEDDETVATAVGASPETVFRARCDLHLVRAADAPIDPTRLRREYAEADPATVAADLDVPVAAVERSRAVLAARTAASRVSDRYRAAFVDALPDAAIASTMTDAVREDGLWEATEDIDALDSDADVDF